MYCPDCGNKLGEGFAENNCPECNADFSGIDEVEECQPEDIGINEEECREVEGEAPLENKPKKKTILGLPTAVMTDESPIIRRTKTGTILQVPILTNVKRPRDRDVVGDGVSIVGFETSLLVIDKGSVKIDDEKTAKAMEGEKGGDVESSPEKRMYGVPAPDLRELELDEKEDSKEIDDYYVPGEYNGSHNPDTIK